MKTRRLTLVFLCCLAACDNGSVRDTLGLTRRAPDEFQVISRPPLSVPPEFNLRPPAGPGETDALGAEVSPRLDAKTAVLGAPGGEIQPGNAATAVQPVATETLQNAADAQFLTNARATQADENIRSVLMQEAPPPSQEQEKTMLEKIQLPKKQEPVVDPKAEAERLKNAKEAGQPVTAGDTPMVKPKDTGPLGRLLGY